MEVETRSRRGTKGAATRERILDAAAAEFRIHGFTGTRLADIAARASTQAGSMYYHFASREELVREVLQIGQQRTNHFVITHVEGLDSGLTSLDRLRAAAVAHLRAVLSISDYTAATLRILGQVPDEIRENTLRLQRTYGRFWRELFETAQDDGYLGDDLDIRSAQMILLGAINASADWFQPGRSNGLTLEQLETQLVAVFFEGLTTPDGREDRQEQSETSAELPATPVPDDEGRGAVTAARILDAAAKTFRAKGYAGTRLVDVATAAQMQTGSLYYHFDSREDLVARLLHDAWERTYQYVRRSVDELPIGTSPINQLGTVMTAHLLSVLGDSDYTSAMLRVLGQVPAEVRDEMQPLQRQYLDLWRNLLKQAIKEGQVRSDLDIPALAMLLTGALNWVVEWYSPNEYPAPDKLAIQFGRVIFDGIPIGTHDSKRKPPTTLDSNQI